MSQQITKYDVLADAKDIIIFVHGFGVRWDSRGMFTDLQKSLPKSWGNVLFDFYEINGNDVYITDINCQINRLKDIISTVKSKSPKANIHIIAHSKGCIITALVAPKITGQVVLLAPPEAFGTKVESYFRRYPGAKASDKALIIPRKDGTTSHIPMSFFKQAAKIDGGGSIKQYSDSQLINLLQTTKDEVIGKTEYKELQNNSNIKITQLASDHNFTNINRAELISYILHTLKADSTS